MARYSQRPENALKRANEFMDVGKPSRALETLYEVFKNKKWAYTWSESLLEPIMFKYLDLCVDLKKSVIAKEGLFQYRNMFQSVNVGSLENVIRGYLKMAEDKTESAREQSQQAVIDIDDLDNVATPESILLRAVSGEDAQDRSDRTILTPWVKFLWESYCQCLELLRTNAHCETLYHDIVRMAFNFCLKYNRKTEFRKLSDKLRKHLDDINKPATQVSSVSLSKAETQQYNLETRLVQLDSAIQMELWQEAYKAIEDIHALMNISKKPPVSKTMANYYQKLAMVFWKAGYYLFHAAALFKLFQLSKDMKKNITHDELQRMACCVLLATLSIPLPSAHPEFDRFIETDKSPLEKTQRLATLLTLQQPPTRASLIRDLVRMNVVQRASPELQELYQALEIDFNPLTLCERVHTVTSQLQGDEQYIPPLQDVTLVKLIRQVSQVYQTIKFDRLLELALFTTPFHLERLLVDCVRHNDMQIRIDHGAGCVNFGMDLSETPRENAQDGPILQSMPSDQLRTQLINMANVLNEALNVINPNFNRAAKDKVRMQLVHHYEESMVNEHKKILERHQLIEDRKEHLERINTARVKEEKRRADELAHLQAQMEERRLQQEREERERRRQENEIQQIKDRNFKEKMQQISQTAHGQKMLRKLDEEEIKRMDAEQIAIKEAEELQKERKEMLQKLKSQEKKVDYFERAKRLEEIPLLQQSFAQRQVEEKKLWEEQEAQRIAELVVERERAVETRKRLARMVDDRREFLAKLSATRNSVYQDKLKKYQDKWNEERTKRFAARKEQRIAERKAEWEEKEEMRKKEAEKQAKIEEEKQARLEEEKERTDALNKQAAMQRQREEEALKKQQDKEKQLAGSGRAVWRSKTVQEREDKAKPLDRADKMDRSERSERSEEGGSGSWRSSVNREADIDDRDRERSAFGSRRDDDKGFGRRMDDRGFGRRERDDDRGGFGMRRPMERERDDIRRRMSPPRTSDRRGDDRFGSRGFGDRDRSDRPREQGSSSFGNWRRTGETDAEKEPPRRAPSPPAEEKKEWRREVSKPAPPTELSAPPPVRDDGDEGDDNTWKTVGRR